MVSRIRGFYFGSPHVKDFNILGSYWGPFIFGNYQMDSAERMPLLDLSSPAFLQLACCYQYWGMQEWIQILAPN